MTDKTMIAVQTSNHTSIDQALEGRFTATSLALAVLGLNAELEAFELDQEEISRRVTAVALLAADVLKFTAKLEAALDKEA
jgi:hypothetical protein